MISSNLCKEYLDMAKIKTSVLLQTKERNIFTYGTPLYVVVHIIFKTLHFWNNLYIVV